MQSVINSPAKLEATAKNLHCTVADVLNEAQLAISEWEVTESTDISWRHLVNTLRIRFREGRRATGNGMTLAEWKQKFAQDCQTSAINQLINNSNK